MKFWILLVALAILISGPLRAADEIVGSPYFRSYSFEEIGEASPGIRLGSDRLGRLIVFQDGAVSVFDDKNWDRFLEPGAWLSMRQIVPSLTGSELYYGGAGDWGVLEYGADGALTMKRLRGEDAPGWTKENPFEHVLVLEDAVVFGSLAGLIYYDIASDSQRYFPLQNLTCLFQIGSDVYAGSFSEALHRLDLANGELVKLPDFQWKPLVFDWITKRDDESIFAVNFERRLVIYDGERVEYRETEIDSLLENGLVEMLQLDRGRLAVAIKGKGLYILKSNGELERGWEGVEFRGIHDLFYNEPGVLWLSTSSGVTKLLYDSPATNFDQRLGLVLKWPRIIVHEGVTHILSDEVLYQPKDSRKGFPTQFQPMELEVDQQPLRAWSVESVQGGLLLGNGSGVYFRSNGGMVEQVFSGLDAHRIVALDASRSVSAVIGPEGIAVIRNVDGKWQQHGEVLPGVGFPSGVHVTESGSVWLEVGMNLVARVVFRDDELTVERFEDFPWEGESWINIGSVGRYTVLTGNGMRLYFDEETESFEENASLEALLNSSPFQILRMKQDVEGIIWATHSSGLVCMVPTEEGGYQLDLESMSLVRENFPYLSILEGTDVWLHAENYLLRVDRDNVGYVTNKAKPVLLHVVDARTNKEVYNAATSSLEALKGISYQENSLSFHFFPGTYSQLRYPNYSYMLDRYSEDWSMPTSDTAFGFTGLSEGAYRIQFMIQDRAGYDPQIASYAFSIRPPIYRTWYAYFGYAIASFVLVALAVQWATHRARKQKERLEELVRKRTEELDVANEELRRSVVIAEKAGRAKSQFLANMSHEIRTPMNGVMGMCTLLQDTALDDVQSDYVHTIRSSSETLMDIINDILDFSKIEAGKLQLESIAFDVMLLVEEVFDLLSAHLGDKRIDLIFHPADNVSRMRIGDPTRLRQILVNLVGNAIKFTESGEICVLLSEERDSGELLFEVEDQGIGINEERLQDLFKPFSQEDESVTRKYGGTGLGLSISKMLVEAMGGRIWATSRIGKGSTFHFTLPAKVDEGRNLENRSKFQGKRALVFCDGKRCAESIERSLARGGFAVERCETLDGFISRLEDGPDVAVVSPSAKSSQGVEWITKICEHANAANPPVLALVGIGEAKALQLREGLMIIDVLIKPVHNRQLLQSINGLFEQGKQSKAGKVRRHELKPVALGVRIRVLLVEDNPVNQKVALLILDKLGFRADVAGNGLEGVDSVLRQQYDVVFMDVQMPEMGGLDATRAIRAKDLPWRQPLIFAMSAGVSDANRQECIEAGMDGFVSKPINVDNLKNVLEHAVEHLKARPEDRS